MSHALKPLLLTATFFYAGRQYTEAVVHQQFPCVPGNRPPWRPLVVGSQDRQQSKHRLAVSPLAE